MSSSEGIVMVVEKRWRREWRYKKGSGEEDRGHSGNRN